MSFHVRLSQRTMLALWVAQSGTLTALGHRTAAVWVLAAAIAAVLGMVTYGRARSTRGTHAALTVTACAHTAALTSYLAAVFTTQSGTVTSPLVGTLVLALALPALFAAAATVLASSRSGGRVRFSIDHPGQP